MLLFRLTISYECVCETCEKMFVCIQIANEKNAINTTRKGDLFEVHALRGIWQDKISSFRDALGYGALIIKIRPIEIFRNNGGN